MRQRRTWAIPTTLITTSLSQQRTCKCYQEAVWKQQEYSEDDYHIPEFQASLDTYLTTTTTNYHIPEFQVSLDTLTFALKSCWI
jgi:hypothetical protein